MSAYVGSGGTNLNNSGLTRTNNYAPTSGNLLIIIGGQENMTGPFSLTDSRGNTIPSPTSSVSVGILSQIIWIIPNCIGGSGNFSFTASAGTGGMNLDIYEFSGLSATGALDGALLNVINSGGTTISTGNLQTTFTGSLLFSTTMVRHVNQTSITHSLAGGTQYLFNSNSLAALTSDGYGVIGAATGIYSDTATLSASDVANDAMISFFAIQTFGVNTAGIAWIT